jgi:hypothetical protein
MNEHRILAVPLVPASDPNMIAARDDTAFSLTWQPFLAQAVNKYRMGLYFSCELVSYRPCLNAKKIWISLL